VPPVLDDVRRDLGLSSASAGLLTTVPVLCFGLVAPLAPRIARRTGLETLLLLCLLVLTAGIALRLVPSAGPLFAGTIVLGVGIAVANVVMPSIIKRDFPRPGPMMGIYSMSLSGSAAISAGLTVPLEGAFGSWRWALAAGAIPALIAVVAWLPALAARDSVPVDPPPPVRLWRNGTAWFVAGVFGTQSMLFFATLAWLPDILRAHGMSSGTAGAMLSIAMVLGIPSAFLIPILAGRMRDQRVLVVAAAMLWLAGLLGVLLSPSSAVAAWMVLIGLAQGASIALALILFVLRAPDDEHAAALSGMAQTVGYMMAAVAPLALGLLHDATGGWQAPLVAMLGGVVALLVCGLGAGRPRFVSGQRRA
jgi:CP family cyanate transporter-like MFS transporter